MKSSEITAVIIAKNEAQMLKNCIETLQWCSEILVIDDGSTDDTAKIAEQTGARVIQYSNTSFAKLRNEALKHVKTNWIFYIDADERVTPTLAKEIMVQMETSEAGALLMHRSNIFFGRTFAHGGWEQDTVTRIFRKSDLKEWQGMIHESPIFNGEVVTLQTPLIHFSHRNIVSGLHKTASWTPMEAELLYESGLPKVGVLTILRKGCMEFLRRGVLKKGYKDGEAGLVEAIIQGINRMLVYAQVWELQQKPPLSDQYTHHEAKITKQWSDQS
jgi:glycosyltransferase involved in cell wall biosynthesis